MTTFLVGVLAEAGGLAAAMFSPCGGSDVDVGGV